MLGLARHEVAFIVVGAAVLPFAIKLACGLLYGIGTGDWSQF